MSMTKEEVEQYVSDYFKDPEDAFEYLNGMENEDGTYEYTDVRRYIRR